MNTASCDDRDRRRRGYGIRLYGRVYYASHRYNRSLAYYNTRPDTDMSGEPCAILYNDRTCHEPEGVVRNVVPAGTQVDPL